MRSLKTPFAFLAELPPSDRRTFSFDAPAGTLVGVFNGLSITFVGIIGRRLGLGTHELALLSMSAFVGLFLNVWIGHLSSKGRAEAWVLIPGLLSRFLVAFALVSLSPWLYLALMSAFNVIANVSGPAYTSIMRSNYSERHRGELMGYVRVLIQIATALSAAFAGWLMEALPGSQTLLFPLAAVAGIASSLLFFRIKVPPEEGAAAPAALEPAAAASSSAQPAPLERAAPLRAAPASGFRAAGSSGFGEALSEVLADRRFLLYMAIYFVIGFPDKIVVPLEPIRFVDELHMRYSEAGLIQGTLPFVGALLGYLLYARGAKQADPFLALLVTTLLASTRYLNTALAATAPQLAPGAFLNGMSNAGWDLIPMFSLMLFARDDRRLGFYFGFHGTMVGLRGLLGPLVGTWLYAGLHLRIATVYLLAFGLELLGAALLLPFWAGLRREGFGSPLARAAEPGSGADPEAG